MRINVYQDEIGGGNFANGEISSPRKLTIFQDLGVVPGRDSNPEALFWRGMFDPLAAPWHTIGYIQSASLDGSSLG